MLRPGMIIAILLSFSASGQTTRPDAERELAHDVYKEFVEIQSGYTTGATTPVAEAAAARLKAGGFADSDIFVGGAIPTKANLVVRYRGTRAGKPILLLAHIDVVEAKREDWSTDPFQFIEKDGFYYGRGTADDKAQAAVWIANLIHYKKEGFKPDRDIIVALTADEEGGGPYSGIQWLLKNHRELIEAEYALNEGGWGEESKGKKISNDLQVSEKYVINFRFEVRNKGGHSSLPVPDNAIYHLAGALDRLSKFGFPLKTNAVTSAYFQEMSKIDSSPHKDDLAKAAENSPEAMQRVATISPAWNATLRTTCVATMLEGGHAVNALPQLAAATVNCRVLPEDRLDYVESTLRTVIADDQVTIKLIGEPRTRVRLHPFALIFLRRRAYSRTNSGRASRLSRSWLWAQPMEPICDPRVSLAMGYKASLWTAMTCAFMAAMSAWAFILSMRVRLFSMNWLRSYRHPIDRRSRKRISQGIVWQGDFQLASSSI